MLFVVLVFWVVGEYFFFFEDTFSTELGARDSPKCTVENKCEEMKKFLLRRIPGKCRTRAECKKELEFQIKSLVPVDGAEKIKELKKEYQVVERGLLACNTTSAGVARKYRYACAYPILTKMDKINVELQSIPRKIPAKMDSLWWKPDATIKMFTVGWVSRFNVKIMKHLKEVLKKCGEDKECKEEVEQLKGKVGMSIIMPASYPRSLVSKVVFPPIFPGHNEMLKARRFANTEILVHGMHLSPFHRIINRRCIKRKRKSRRMRMCLEEFLVLMQKQKDGQAMLELYRTYHRDNQRFSKRGAVFRRQMPAQFLEMKACGWDKACKMKFTKKFEKLITRNVLNDHYNVPTSLSNVSVPSSYKDCLIDCTAPYYVHLTGASVMEKTMTRVLDVTNLMEILCETKECHHAVDSFRRAVLPLVVRAGENMDNLVAQSVDPIYSYIGMAFTSVVIVGVIACIICGVLWKTISELKAFTLVIIGVAVANAIRLSWWVLLKLSYLRYNTDSIKSFQQFIRIPDIIVLNVMFLVLALLLFFWVDGMHSVLFPTHTKASLVFKIGFGAASIGLTLYCVGVVIGYIVITSTSNGAIKSTIGEGSIDGFWYDLAQLSWDKVTEILAITNVALSLGLFIYCCIAMYKFRDSRDRMFAVLKFGVICFILLGCFVLRLVYAVSLMIPNLEPPFYYTFGVNYLLAEFLISTSILVFVFLAYYSASHRKGYKEMEEGESSESLLSEEMKVIPDRYEM